MVQNTAILLLCVSLRLSITSGWCFVTNEKSNSFGDINIDQYLVDRRTTFKKTISNIAIGCQGILLSQQFPQLSNSFEASDTESSSPILLPVEVVASGDAKKLFNEGRAFESQGNMAAAQRLYSKVTQISPRFIYGHSNLGNTQTALGDLKNADVSYTTAIDLCYENLRTIDDGFGKKRCTDLYILLLNRGSIRLNTGRYEEALADLKKSSELRGIPDAIVLQNLARAEELNGLYASADRDYNLAISMTANEVTPLWLRSALVKYQLDDVQGGYDLLKRVENRFPEAPEVRAAYATFLMKRGNQEAAQRKFLEIPDRQRLKYVDTTYLTQTIHWPPKAIETLAVITSAVGDVTRLIQMQQQQQPKQIS